VQAAKYAVQQEAATVLLALKTDRRAHSQVLSQVHQDHQEKEVSTSCHNS